ncbi:hypothetical protein CAEBREN_13422 [Caenorhabditis brenneri]|uniref:F-box associated domain-containing protein n=1 Tax=Caenorhabditis brenneri TaxID=135651 RepID=G0NGJ7_CAEBE|nr:hypothetical protein CAEBREN_13422 [Caenorhabditis brenneri]
MIKSITNKNHCEAIWLNNKNEQGNKVFYVNIGAVDRVPSDYTETEEDHDKLILTTYWDDRMQSFKVLYDVLVDVFHAAIDAVIMDLNEVSVEKYQELFDWIEDHFSTLPTFRIIGRCSFQNYIWLMKTVKANNSLQFLMEPTEYPENLETVDLEADKVIIKYGKWLKIKDIQAIKARDIAIEDVLLTDNEINALLKNLDAFKEKSNVKTLTLDFLRAAEPEVVLEGLNAINEDEMKPTDCLNQWSFVLSNGEKCTVIYAEYHNNLSDDLVFGFDILIGN